MPEVKSQSDIDKLYSIALWYKRLCDTNNTAFLPLFADTHRYLVLKGGGGSGKSIFAGRKILERATSEAGHRFLVCRKVGKTLRESCFRQLCSQISRHYGEIKYQVNQTDMRITFGNGSEIIFSGLDDVEKLKSIFGITGIWIEEATELDEGDLNQLDIRLRDRSVYYQQIILSFNPVSSQHWLKKRFFDRECPDARVHESNYKDNRFATEQQIKTLEAFRETDSYFYSVYCLGMWGVTGKTVFNARAVGDRLAENIKPVKRGYFDYIDTGTALIDVRFIESDDGFIQIYKDYEDGVPYVIGGDTAGEGSDSFVGQVIDNRTGNQVCVLRHTMDEDLYSKQMYCLGLYYGTALVGIETNYSTYPVMELERLGYPNQYVRESIDDFTHSVKHSYGFVTNSKTRPVIISVLIAAVRDDINIVCDADTLGEMLTFVRNEDFRPEAEAGAHDDCVMSLAIAHYIRSQQSYVAAAGKSTVKWTESMYEDYNNASPDEKEMLIKRWGKPGL